MPGRVRISGFGSKLDLLSEHCTDAQVLHLGAVGETYMDTSIRVERIKDSVHAHLTKIAAKCVGVDNDEPSVTAITQSGAFTNIMCADVTKLGRDDIGLDRIDVIVAGDIVEHLSEPGSLFDVAAAVADPGTRLLVTTPNALGAVIMARYLRGREIEGLDHVCSFNAYTLRNLIERHGWKLERMATCYQPSAAQHHSRAAFQIGQVGFSCFPALGGTLLAVCRRAGS